jgi:hypothetical protein
MNMELNKQRERWLRQLHQQLVKAAEVSGLSEARLALSDGCIAIASKRAGIWTLYFIL